MILRPSRFPRLIGLAVILVGLSSPLRADDDDCDVPMSDWQPRAVVAQMAAQQGWEVRRIKIDKGCYQIYALDAQGQLIEIKVNPATLEILKIEQESAAEMTSSDGDDTESD